MFIVVSILPPFLHFEIAEICSEKKIKMITDGMKKSKNEKLVEFVDQLESLSDKGLNVYSISYNLNNLGVDTINFTDILKATSSNQELRQKTLNSIEKKIVEYKSVPTGNLSINTTVAFGSMWLSPRINEFIHEYPEINLKLNYSEDEQDMLRQDYDIGLWMRKPRHLDLVSKHIATIKYLSLIHI